VSDISKSADSRNSNLSFHPLADIFPLMEGEEFDALVADIKANGQREPITLYQGKILDGRNRYRACLAAGVGLKLCKHKAGCSYIGDPATYVISANIHRRHLTADQKRDLIARLLKAQPTKSNRQIAKTAKVDHKTVGAVRAQQEATGEIPQLKKTVGKDGKARKQPAKKAKSTTAAVPEFTAGDWVMEAMLDATTMGKAKRGIRAEKVAADIERLASKLIELDRDIARALQELLESPDRDVSIDCLEQALMRGLARTEVQSIIKSADEAKPPPDDGLDIPECLRRGAP
jgi:hypothetical protein